MNTVLLFKPFGPKPLYRPNVSYYLVGFLKPLFKGLILNLSSESKKEYNKNYYYEHKKEQKERDRINREIRRENAYNLLGNKCSNPYNLPHPDWCNDINLLQIDHVNGGGLLEIRALGRQGVLRRVIKRPEDYQLLCPNCNWLKRIKNNEIIKWE